MKIKTSRINWDTDGCQSTFNCLPQEIEIEVESEDDTVDQLSDDYGFCIESLSYEIVK